MKQYEAKSVDEILDLVSKEKGVSKEEITYFVKEEKKGFLGLKNTVVVEAYCDKDVEVFIKEYLDKFFKGLGINCEITINKENDYYRILLNAENNAILIGKNGQTLEAINTVLKAAVSSEFKKRFHVLVDINNYKTDRYDKIKGIAYRVANSVKKSHVNATLDPMPSDERRVIHNFLSDMENIKTESEGDGRDRRVKIIYDANKK